MAPFTVGIFALIACIVISRMLSEHAFRSLSGEQKLALMEAFSGMRAYSMLPMVLILAAVFGLLYLFPDHHRTCFLASLLILLLYVAVVHVFVLNRLNSVDLPAGYKRSFLVARHINHAGMLVFFGCLFYDVWR